MAGDRHLIECLVVNLVDNALHYNLDHGRVDILTATKAGAAVLSVSNTGAVVPASAVDRLLQPFQRIARERTGHGEGLGLGLSIVEAIATSHGGTLTLYPPPDGGLEVTVSFPAANLPAVNQSIIEAEPGENLPTRSTPSARRAIAPAQPSSPAMAPSPQTDHRRDPSARYPARSRSKRHSTPPVSPPSPFSPA
jgi:hypothetical protein